MPYLLPQLVLGGRVQHHGAGELDATGVAAGVTRPCDSEFGCSQRALIVVRRCERAAGGLHLCAQHVPRRSHVLVPAGVLSPEFTGPRNTCDWLTTDLHIDPTHLVHWQPSPNMQLAFALTSAPAPQFCRTSHQAPQFAARHAVTHPAALSSARRQQRVAAAAAPDAGSSSTNGADPAPAAEVR